MESKAALRQVVKTLAKSNREHKAEIANLGRQLAKSNREQKAEIANLNLQLAASRKLNRQISNRFYSDKVDQADCKKDIAAMKDSLTAKDRELAAKEVTSQMHLRYMKDWKHAYQELYLERYKLNKDLAEVTMKLTHATIELTQADDRHARECNILLENSRDKNGYLQDALLTRTKQIDSTTAEITALKQQATTTTAAMSGLKAEKAALNTSLDAQKKASEELAKEDGQLREAIEKKDERVGELEKEVHDLQASNDSIAKDLRTKLEHDHKVTVTAIHAGHTVQLEKAASEMKTIKQELHQARKDHESCEENAKESQTQIAELKAEVKLLQDYASKSRQQRFVAWAEARNRNGHLQRPIDFDVRMTMVQYLQRHIFESDDEIFAASEWAWEASNLTEDECDEVRELEEEVGNRGKRVEALKKDAKEKEDVFARQAAAINALSGQIMRERTIVHIYTHGQETAFREKCAKMEDEHQIEIGGLKLEHNIEQFNAEKRTREMKVFSQDNANLLDQPQIHAATARAWMTGENMNISFAETSPGAPIIFGASKAAHVAQDTTASQTVEHPSPDVAPVPETCGITEDGGFTYSYAVDDVSSDMAPAARISNPAVSPTADDVSSDMAPVAGTALAQHGDAQSPPLPSSTVPDGGDGVADGTKKKKRKRNRLRGGRRAKKGGDGEEGENGEKEDEGAVAETSV